MFSVQEQSTEKDMCTEENGENYATGNFIICKLNLLLQHKLNWEMIQKWNKHNAAGVKK